MTDDSPAPPPRPPTPDARQFELLVKAITDYYHELFSSQRTPALQVVDEVLSPVITTEMNNVLTRIPDKFEIRQAVFSINPDKAPGLDGFSASFY